VGGPEGEGGMRKRKKTRMRRRKRRKRRRKKKEEEKEGSVYAIPLNLTVSDMMAAAVSRTFESRFSIESNFR